MALVDPRHAAALGLHARHNGAEPLSRGETSWDISRFCEKPARVTVDGRPYRGTSYQVVGYERGTNIFNMDDNRVFAFVRNDRIIPGIVGNGHRLYLDVPCGKCARCLAYRRGLWTRRAIAECERPETRRTWFATLTANPATQLRWTGEAFKRLSEGGTKPTELTNDEWYTERCKEAGRELTKMVKRLRKNTGATIRCLWVFEKHDGGGPHAGLPHIHGLIHECSDTPVSYRALKAEWSAGHARFNLTGSGESEQVARYVCAYLMKSSTTRVRASRGYGDMNHLVDRTRSKSTVQAAQRPVREQEGTLPKAPPDPAAAGVHNGKNGWQAPEVPRLHFPGDLQENQPAGQGEAEHHLGDLGETSLRETF